MRKPTGKALLALFGLSLYLFMAALASSPELHHLFHDDADSSEHQCAATIIAQGQLDASPTTVVVVLPSVVCFPATAPKRVASASVDFWLPPERAPPVSSC